MIDVIITTSSTELGITAQRLDNKRYLRLNATPDVWWNDGDLVEIPLDWVHSEHETLGQAIDAR